MRTSTTTRLALAAAGLLALGSYGTASAAAKPAKPAVLSFTDAAGDALATQKAYDITKVSITTKGTGAGKAYKPKSLVLSLTINGAPSKTAGTAYEIDFSDVSGCGYANFTYTPGALSEGGVFTECGSPDDGTGNTSTLYDAPPTVSGSTITWDVPLNLLSPEFRKGAVMSGISAKANQNDPVFGLLGTGALLDEGNWDYATTDKSFTV